MVSPLVVKNMLGDEAFIEQHFPQVLADKEQRCLYLNASSRTPVRNGQSTDFTVSFRFISRRGLTRGSRGVLRQSHAADVCTLLSCRLFVCLDHVDYLIKSAQLIT